MSLASGQSQFRTGGDVSTDDGCNGSEENIVIRAAIMTKEPSEVCKEKTAPMSCCGNCRHGT